MNKHNNFKKGFTLIEVMMVMMAVSVFGAIILVNIIGVRDDAKREKARTDIIQIYKAIEYFEHDTEEWPGHLTPYLICSALLPGCNSNEICDDGCTYSLGDPEGGLAQTDDNYDNWNGPYLRTIPIDPWGNEYFFDTDYDLNLASGDQGEYGIVIGSYGPNGVGNNTYDKDDIIRIIKR